MTRMKVTVSELGIYDAPMGNKKGTYYKGDVIRTIDLGSKKCYTDGQIWVRFTQAGGHFFNKTYNWVVYENTKGNTTMELDE